MSGTKPKKASTKTAVVTPSKSSPTTTTASGDAKKKTKANDEAKNKKKEEEKNGGLLTFLNYRATFTRLQNSVLDAYSTGKRECDRVPMLDFASHDITENTACVRCGEIILGACDAAYYVSNFYDSDTIEPTWFHESCFVCAATKVEADGKSSRCGSRVAYKHPEDSSRLFCYVNVNNLAVCAHHICKENIEFPSFNPKTEAGKAAKFMAYTGFAILDTDITPEKADKYYNWEKGIAELMCGINPTDADQIMNNDAWNAQKHYPGNARSEIGIIGHAGMIEGESDHVNNIRLDAFRAEPITQAREIWEVRSDVLCAAYPFFEPTENILTTMAPLVLIAKASLATHNGAPRCFAEEKRTKNLAVVDEEGVVTKAGRKTAIRTINGVVVFNDATDGEIRVFVCPSSWKDEKSGSTEPVTFTEVWNKCVPRAPDFGIFPPSFPLAPYMVPVKLRKGQVVVWDSFRPFSLHSNPEKNILGSEIGWFSLAPKTQTLGARAIFVTQGVVPQKAYMQAGYKHSKLMDNFYARDTPLNFADTLTPMTREDVGRFANVIFGTLKTDPNEWPKEYRIDNIIPDAPPAEHVKVDTPDVGIIPERKSVAQKKQKMSDEAPAPPPPPAAKAAAAPPKAKAPIATAPKKTVAKENAPVAAKKPTPKAVEEEEENDSIPMELEEDEAPPPKAKEPVVVKKAAALPTKTQTKSVPEKKPVAPKPTTTTSAIAKAIQKAAPTTAPKVAPPPPKKAAAPAAVVEAPKKKVVIVAPTPKEDEDEDEEEVAAEAPPPKSTKKPRAKEVVEEEAKDEEVVEDEEEEADVKTPAKKSKKAPPSSSNESVELPSPPPPAKKKVPALPEDDVEEGDDDGGEGGGEEESSSKKKAPRKKVTMASKKRAAKELEYPRPYPEESMGMEDHTVPHQLRMQREFLTQGDVTGAFGSLFIGETPTLTVSKNHDESARFRVKDSRASLELMDVFERLGIDEGEEEMFRDLIDEVANADRGGVLVTGKESRKLRNVVLYGKTAAKLEGRNRDPEKKTPQCIKVLLEKANETLLSIPTAADGEEDDEEGGVSSKVPVFDQVIAFGNNKIDDTISKIKRGDLVARGSHVLLVCLGSSGRILRVRVLVEQGDDEKSTKHKEGVAVHDISTFSGLGIYSDNSFFDAEDGIVVEMPAVKAGPWENTPFVLLMITAGIKGTAKKAKSEGGGNKKAPAKKKKNGSNTTSGAAAHLASQPIVYGKSYNVVKDEVKAFFAENEELILGDEKIGELCTRVANASVEAHKKKGKDPYTLAEFRAAFAKVYKIVKGVVWDDGVAADREAAKKRAKEAASAAAAEEDDEGEGGDDEDVDEEVKQPPKKKGKASAAPKAPIKPAKPVKNALVDEEEMERAGNPGAIPEKTRKAVLVGGKVAVRGTRERKPAAPSKAEAAEEAAREIEYTNYKASEAARRRKCTLRGMKFVETTFKQYLRKRNMSHGKDDFAIGRAEYADEEDDDEFDVDEEDEEEFEDDDDDDSGAGGGIAPGDRVIDESDSGEEGDPLAGAEEEDVEDELINMAAKIESLTSYVDMVHDTYPDILSNKKEADTKAIAKAYNNADEAAKICQGEIDNPAEINEFQAAVEKLRKLLEAYLEKNPKKRVAKKAKVAKLPEDGKEVAQIHGLAVEGWNPECNPEISDLFVRSLTYAGNMLVTALQTGGTAHYGIQEQFQLFSTLTGPAPFTEEIMNTFIDVVEEATAAFAQGGDGEDEVDVDVPQEEDPIIIEDEQQQQQQQEEEDNGEQMPMDQDAEEEQPVAEEYNEPVLASPPRTAEEEDDTGGSGVEEVAEGGGGEAEPMEIDNEPIAEGEGEEQEQPAADEEEVSPTIPDETLDPEPPQEVEQEQPQAEDEEEEQQQEEQPVAEAAEVADEEANLEGSAQEAAQDHVAVVPPDEQKEVAPEEVGDAKLDFVVAKKPAATANGKANGRLRGDKFATVLPNGKIFATADTQEEASEYTITQISARAPAAKEKPDSYFKTLPIPPNWRNVLQTTLKVGPEAATIEKLARDVTANHLWPNGEWK